ncbi:helix-turn-helix transcriptional regulator [Enterobacter asburiae]|uniref:helix-turn-helix domain-containing protein n=1 Tax=Enterobacter asburiae TaxID=61645 RepID=UPI002005555F|nr:helix-turn-helix transcriptional regulator [Enterobacter asburiae]MCK7230004.1 helix-turn-helix transcriptional regulator [Enterobacter asburiae]
MEKKPGRLFICTDDYYLYYGAWCSLTVTLGYDIIWLKSIESLHDLVWLNLREDDTVILLTEINLINYTMLLSMYQREFKIFIRDEKDDISLKYLFNFIILNRDCGLNDLLFAIHASNYKYNTVLYPKITPQEKRILTYTLKGYTVKNISDLLEVSEKTIYNHQRSALKKLGVRKIINLFKLPRNLLDQLLSVAP